MLSPKNEVQEARFEALDFHEHRNHGVGKVARAFFPNGYGVSVICTPYSYGGKEGLYELAVLAGTEDEHGLIYDTPITDDVLGYLSPADVTEHMQAVASLSSGDR